MIGVFDSGVGGLSVLLELVRLMPEQDYVYVADTRYCPYGPKSVDVIRERSSVISQFLIDKGAEVVVVACNTATAASVSLLRSAFPVPFVGMEPAIKPAAALSRSGVVGVLATANTFNGSLYHHTRDTYATEVTVIERVGEGLVELVEQGQLEGPQTEAVVRRCVEPMLAAAADVVVLGCTHYPFLTPVLRQLVGPRVEILNPAPAIAVQTQRVLQASHEAEPSSLPSEPRVGSIAFCTTGDSTDMLKKMADRYFSHLPNLSFVCLDL
ncbi:MAG: glutamate racemase [Bacteroidales bacterium]|nr:glutamate racemase [Bacteroidales bacterium]